MSKYWKQLLHIAILILLAVLLSWVFYQVGYGMGANDYCIGVLNEALP